MGFKDFIAADLATFINSDELADVHDIDGQQVPAMLDSDVLSTAGVPDGVYEKELMLFVKLSDLGYRPVIGQHMRVDGEWYLVNKCNENAGLLEVTLAANQA